MNNSSLPNFLEFAVLTDVGRCRDENQDDYLIFTEYYSFFAVADGMGGAGGGATASEMTVKLLEEKLALINKLNPLILVNSLIAINTAIYELGLKDQRLNGMGTTLCALAFQEHELLVLNIGDSRAYRLRGDNISKLTRDHTLANELYQSGSITGSSIEDHPSNHMLTRSLGPVDKIEPDCWWHRSSLLPNDVFLICSDGLYNLVEEEEFVQIVNNSKNLEDSCKELVKLANDRGGIDNITVILIRVNSKYRPLGSSDEEVLTDTIRVSGEEIETKKPSKILLLSSLLSLCLLVMIGWFLFSKEEVKELVKNNKASKELEQYFQATASDTSSSNNQDSIPRVQNFLERVIDIDALIERNERIVSFFEEKDVAKIDERVVVLKNEIKEKLTGIGKLKIELENEARKLGKWYLSKNQDNKNLFIKVGRELEEKNADIRELREEYEKTSWRYLNALDKTREDQSKEKIEKLKKLVKEREDALDKLILKVKGSVVVKIEELNKSISSLTLKKYKLEKELNLLRDEVLDMELAKEIDSKEALDRIKELKQSLVDLNKEKEALEKFL